MPDDQNKPLALRVLLLLSMLANVLVLRTAYVSDAKFYYWLCITIPFFIFTLYFSSRRK